MSLNAFWIWHLIAVLLPHGHPARFDGPVSVERRVKTTMKFPVYPTLVTWSRDLPNGSPSYKIWQQTSTTKPDIADSTPSSLTMTSPATVQSEVVEDTHKSYSDSTPMDGSSFNSSKLTNSLYHARGNMDIDVAKDLVKDNKEKNQETFNCTQIGDTQTTQSESTKNSEKIPQIQVASENAECTLDEQNTADFKRTLLDITDSMNSGQNHPYLLFGQHKASEFVISPLSSRVTEESTDIISMYMGLQRAVGLPEDSTTDKFLQASYFNLAGVELPYCSTTCLDRCDDYPFPDIDDEGWTNPVMDANIQHKFLMSDGSMAQVSLSSTPFSNSCPKERLASQCNCDRKCVVYGDCCPDVFHVCWHLNTSKEVESLIATSQNNLFISLNQRSVTEELRQNASNSQRILDHLYATYGSCQIKDKIYDRWMMFVSRCPDVTHSSLKQSCEQPDQENIPPVTAKLGSVAVAFTNRFCAECHDVLQGEYEVWATVLMCEPGLSAHWWKVFVFYDVDVLLKYNLCNLTFTEREIVCQRRTCMDIERLTAEEERQLQVGVVDGACTQRDSILCRSYYFKVDIYRNPHCQKCLQHGDRLSRRVRETMQTVALQPTHSGLHCPSENVRDNKPPFSGVFLILDVSEPNSHNIPVTRSDPLLNTKSDFPNCSLSEIFDPISQACHPLLCLLGQTAERGQCVGYKNINPNLDSPDQSPETKIKVYVWTYSEQLSCQVLTGAFIEAELPNVRFEHIHIYVYGLRNDLTEIITESNNSRQELVCEEQDWENPAHHDTVVHINLTLKTDIDLQTWWAVEKLAEHLFSDDYHMTIQSSADDGPFVCASGAEPRHFTSFQIEEQNGSLQAQVDVQENQLSFPLAYVGYKRSFVKVGNTTKNLTERISVCGTSNLLLKKGCYVIAYTLNDTLKISQVHRQYGEANVDVQGNQVYVCLQQRSEVMTLSYANIRIFKIVHWTMGGTSMLCLVVMLSLYYLFPELLTLPGKMTASLASTMLLTLLSISLTLVDLHHQYLCPVAGAVSHVLVLAQYGWMSVIAFNMAMTFGPKTLNWANSLQDKTFLKYNILVWGISLVLVLTSVILDVVHDDPVEDRGSNSCSNATSAQPGSNRSNTSCSFLLSIQDFPRYGWPVCTWFSGPLWTRLAFVVIPYAITFVINMICFTITLYGIHISNKQVQKLGKSSHPRIQCIIYIKLSTAMGFTSVFGILKTSTHTNDALTYFYMSLILLQGTFLFFAFMTNKRMFSLMKTCFFTRKKSLKSATTFTTRG